MWTLLCATLPQIETPLTRPITNPSNEDALEQLLIFLRKRYPDDTEEKLMKRFRDRVVDDESLSRAAIDFWLSKHTST
jgi:hypothetical protein